MKQRVITGIFVALFLVGYLFCMFTAVFPLLNALLAVLSAYEIHRVAGVKNLPLKVLSSVTAAVVPLACGYARFSFIPAVSFVLRYIYENPAVVGIAYVLIALVLMLMKYEETKFEHLAVSAFAGVGISFSYGCTVLITSAELSTLPQSYFAFFLMFSFGCAWVTDVFALLAGRAFGKHKMCPKISPKKTIEGAIGGVVGAVVIDQILLLIFKKVVPTTPFPSYWLIAVFTVVLAVAGMCGDLSASVIKRNYGAKDYSNLLPGHGGIMDRFDSCLFIWPCLYLLMRVTSLV